ncbi:MAG: twin-arginine translocase subunit TatB [Betaproteobacteria bacterium]|nr:MAG: twin-arginine translocase subunit TatB [Betaproteobacteria bacterium]
MFDVGFSELIIIALVALIVIGPERLPMVARTLGALLGRAQRYVNEVKADIQREVDLDGLKNIRSTFQDAAKSVEESVSQVGEEIRTAGESLNQGISATGEPKAEAEAQASPGEAPADVALEPPSAPAQLVLGLESKPAADSAAAPKA